MLTLMGLLLPIAGFVVTAQWLAPLVGCGLMMAVCMGAMALMGRGRESRPPGDATAEITSLRDEVERLRSRELERRGGADEETTL